MTIFDTQNLLKIAMQVLSKFKSKQIDGVVSGRDSDTQFNFSRNKMPKQDAGYKLQFSHSALVREFLHAYIPGDRSRFWT